jgi:hypothetical protein
MKIILSLLIILMCVLISTGCASNPVIASPCPSVTIPDEPHYPVQDLRRGDSAETVAKAYVATDKLKSAYIKELKNKLEVYR